jgi:DNA-binding transcriptional LysR family regulator
LERIGNHLHFAAILLAEELDFNRAARRLLSVPELKKLIVQLESKLSLVLYEYDSDHVALTASGRLYIEQLRKSRLF